MHAITLTHPRNASLA